MIDTMNARLTTIADTYARLPHTPTAPEVQAAYRTLCGELWTQYQDMIRTINVVFTTEDPYRTSGEMFTDVELFGNLRVYNRVHLPCGHPMAWQAPNGQTFNSIFRAVHDGLAHAPIRASFSAAGELAAFRRHYAMLSPLAGHAVATETLGQNAWFNYGPYAALPSSGRPFAEQKACLLPLTLIEGVLEL
jgi:hypothetical protein